MTTNSKAANGRRPKGFRPGRPNAGGRADAALRAKQALDLRVAGLSYRRIAEQVGVSLETAYSDVQDELAKLAALTAKKAEKVRELELDRLDKLQTALWAKLNTNQGVAAAQAIIKLSERRARLLGIDAPVKVDHAGDLSITLAAERVARFVADITVTRDAAALPGDTEPD